jgi:aspartate oxidase
MKWTHDIGSQLWKARDVKRNTIYDKSYKEPVENVTMKPEGEVTMEPEEEVTMPVKNKLTIRRVKKNLRKLKRTLRMLKKNKQEALLSKQFHSLEMK